MITAHWFRQKVTFRHITSLCSHLHNDGCQEDIYQDVLACHCLIQLNTTFNSLQGDSWKLFFYREVPPFQPKRKWSDKTSTTRGHDDTFCVCMAMICAIIVSATTVTLTRCSNYLRMHACIYTCVEWIAYVSKWTVYYQCGIVWQISVENVCVAETFWTLDLMVNLAPLSFSKHHCEPASRALANYKRDVYWNTHVYTHTLTHNLLRARVHMHECVPDAFSATPRKQGLDGHSHGLSLKRALSH